MHGQKNSVQSNTLYIYSPILQRDAKFRTFLGGGGGGGGAIYSPPQPPGSYAYDMVTRLKAR